MTPEIDTLRGCIADLMCVEQTPARVLQRLNALLRMMEEAEIGRQARRDLALDDDALLIERLAAWLQSLPGTLTVDYTGTSLWAVTDRATVHADVQQPTVYPDEA